MSMGTWQRVCRARQGCCRGVRPVRSGGVVRVDGGNSPPYCAVLRCAVLHGRCSTQKPTQGGLQKRPASSKVKKNLIQGTPYASPLPACLRAVATRLAEQCTVWTLHQGGCIPLRNGGVSILFYETFYQHCGRCMPDVTTCCRANSPTQHPPHCYPS